MRGIVNTHSAINNISSRLANTTDTINKGFLKIVNLTEKQNDKLGRYLFISNTLTLISGIIIGIKKDVWLPYLGSILEILFKVQG